MSKVRNFKKSAVNVDRAQQTKIANDKARKLQTDYQAKIKEFISARDKMMEIASKFATSFDVEKEQEFVSKIIGSLTNVHVFDESNLLKSYINSGNQYNGNLKSNLEYLKVYDRNFKTSVEDIEHAKEISSYMNAIDKFLDIYSEIIGMDPKNDEGRNFKEYATKLMNDAGNTLNKIQSGDIAGAAADVAHGASEAASKVASSVASSLSKGFDFFRSFMPDFAKKEDKEFFAKMDKVDDKKLSDYILNKESNEDDIALETINEAKEESENSQVAQNLPNVDPTKAVLITDASFSDAVHHNNQAEVYFMVEFAKASCFTMASDMQKYVTQNCKVSNPLSTPAKCTEYNAMADLVMKNCATMFPMKTAYDKEIDTYLQNSIRETVVIDSQGAITYIGAGDVTHHQANYIPQLTGGDAVNARNNGQLLLEAEQLPLGGVDNALQIAAH